MVYQQYSPYYKLKHNKQVTVEELIDNTDIFLNLQCFFVVQFTFRVFLILIHLLECP